MHLIHILSLSLWLESISCVLIMHQVGMLGFVSSMTLARLQRDVAVLP
jgi:multisubunit Na+/H+ antiporter MnhF subunit